MKDKSDSFSLSAEYPNGVVTLECVDYFIRRGNFYGNSEISGDKIGIQFAYGISRDIFMKITSNGAMK